MSPAHIADTVAMSEDEEVPVYYAPKGERWPWYPVWRGRGKVATGFDPMQFDVQMSGASKGRVGLRRWVQSRRDRWAARRHSDGPGGRDDA